MRVFLTATSLQTNYGGPAFSVSRLATALVDSGVQVGLWAADGSAPTTQLLPEQSLVQRLDGSESHALERFGSADLLHDNGIWLPHHHSLTALAQGRGIPRVVSLRGMLEPWAFRHKHVKKKVAWWLYQRCDLRKAQIHIATGDAEARNLERFELGVPIVTIPNGVDIPQNGPPSVEAESEKMVSGRSKTALFLGRIYPIKGLPMLIEAWAKVRPRGWKLRIAGPDEAGHQRQVEKAVSDRGLGDVISFVGPVEHEAKSVLFYNVDLFVLPTYSESFGMAIAEALAHRLPVLTTTGAPWPMLEEAGCGWRVEPTLDGIAEGLMRATSLRLQCLRQMGEKGRQMVSSQFSWEHVASQMLGAYELALRYPREHTKADFQHA